MAWAVISASVGSAPRVRGMGIEGGRIGGTARFSPARAGNGCCDIHRHGNTSVQPRACGEWCPRVAGVDRRGGSAPRVRGMARKRFRGSSGRRFSPARAGNGHHGDGGDGDLSVQPRACGEWRQDRSQGNNAVGSAPRVRGMVGTHFFLPPTPRFSPARAGNGFIRTRTKITDAVQPRACGEWGQATSIKRGIIGSAPRVRGMGKSCAANEDAPRFSPARAGNGVPLRSWARRRAVQPRACGEWGRKSLPGALCTGSAPRVRGMECGSVV